MRFIFTTIVVLLILAVGFMGGILFNYDMTYNQRGYDIVLASKHDRRQGYGIRYREQHELWQWKEMFLSTERKRLFAF